jgi:type IV pilus assembly protein PilX
MIIPCTAFRSQRGAALVVGLLLLLVLTVLAISGMNSASVEFIMAGNDQYRQNAFNASETGIERALVTGAFNPNIVAEPVNGAIPNAPADNFTATVNRQLGGVPQGAIWGNSWNAFSTYHFQVQSQGTSARNSQATHSQGVAVLSPFSPPITGPGALN